MGSNRSLTGNFCDLLRARLSHDPAFSTALLRESIDTMLAGDFDTGKAILRDYIKATIGFEKLGEGTGTPAKSPSSACSARAASLRRAMAPPRRSEGTSRCVQFDARLLLQTSDDAEEVASKSGAAGDKSTYPIIIYLT
jgi:hypothetical protein